MLSNLIKMQTTITPTGSTQCHCQSMDSRGLEFWNEIPFSQRYMVIKCFWEHNNSNLMGIIPITDLETLTCFFPKTKLGENYKQSIEATSEIISNIKTSFVDSLVHEYVKKHGYTYMDTLRLKLYDYTFKCFEDISLHNFRQRKLVITESITEYAQALMSQVDTPHVSKISKADTTTAEDVIFAIIEHKKRIIRGIIDELTKDTTFVSDHKEHLMKFYDTLNFSESIEKLEESVRNEDYEYITNSLNALVDSFLEHYKWISFFSNLKERGMFDFTYDDIEQLKRENRDYMKKSIVRKIGEYINAGMDEYW